MTGWQSDVSFGPGRGETNRLGGWAIPGMPNAHSHAFQRAMAGLAERQHPRHPADSFWTWREAMYRLAAAITPDDLEAIAAWLYVEMLEAGYTAVAEFHYLHHDRGGAPFSNPAEMSLALLRAAKLAGIRITLLPVFYAHGGFGKPLQDSQRRFGHASVDAFSRLLERLSGDMHHPTMTLGVAAHSLRAVAPDELAALVAGTGPVHIHIAEQPAEVAQCLEALKDRPVSWLMKTAPVDRRWGLVHATHTTHAEITAMANSGAVAVLCPTTEANLGDGIFDLPTLLAAGGGLAIGSDSHITVDPREELRLLEYGQRLTSLKRNTAATPQQPSTGTRLWLAAVEGGHRCMGGVQHDDVVVLDPQHPRLVGHTPQTALDAFIFASGGGSPIRDVVVGGRRVVEGGEHIHRDAILRRFRQCMKRLQERT